jgi:hypothetical protein
MTKRHFKGASKSVEKRRRKEFAENWKKTRGDGKSSEEGAVNQRSNHRGNEWNTSAPTNPRFDAFYRCQGFLSVSHDADSPENLDWIRFLQYLRTPLPACFRISPDFAFAQALRDQLLALSIAAKESSARVNEIEGVEQIKWVPNGSAYKLGTDRRSIRKLECLQQLHEW